MKIIIIISSVRPFEYLSRYLHDFESSGYLDNVEVLFVDIGGNDRPAHKRNKELSSGIQAKFIHTKDFLKEVIGAGAEKYYDVIPIGCPAEKSIAFLEAWLRKPDMVVTIDDDTYPAQNDFLGDHMRALKNTKTWAISSSTKWFNPLTCLELSPFQELYTRGFPYQQRCKATYTRHQRSVEVVINQGLWLNVPDLDAVTILYQGGMNGIPRTRAVSIKKDMVVLDKGTYTTVCAMNLAFLPKIIPAFYQLPMKSGTSIDRFDDIWSGIFLKKICDSVGEGMSLGRPVVYHDKVPRSIFRDLYSELDGIVLNEILWEIIDEAEELKSSDYISAYRSLTDYLSKQINQTEFLTQPQRTYLNFIIEKMYLWCELCERIEES